MAGKKRNRKNSLKVRAPNGIDMVARIGRDPVYQIITHLSDADLIAFCEAHPNHYRAANVVATYRLLNYWSVEALREHCAQRNLTSIDVLRQAKQYFIDKMRQLFPRGINPVSIPDELKHFYKQIAEEDFSHILEDAPLIPEEQRSDAQKRILINIAPYLIAYGHFDILNHSFITTSKLMLDAAFDAAKELGHDKVMAALIKTHLTARFILGEIRNAYIHQKFSTVALLALDSLMSAAPDVLLALRDEPADLQLIASRKIFKHLRRYIVEMSSELPAENFPCEQLMCFAIQLGCLEEADELALLVDPKHKAQIESFYLSTFITACQRENEVIAEKLLPRVVAILKNMALENNNYTTVYMESMVNLRGLNIESIAIRLARQINALNILFLSAIDRGDTSLVRLLLEKHCKHLPAHVIEQGIYRAINQIPYNAIRLLRALFSVVGKHVSLVAFDVFIEYANDPLVKEMLERQKLAKHEPHAIAHIYTPALVGKRKKIRDSEVKELQEEAGALFKRKRH